MIGFSKISIEFVDKTKSINFCDKIQNKKGQKTKYKIGDIQIKQHFKDTYLGRMLDETMSEVLFVINKTNNKLKCFYGKNRFSTTTRR